MSNPSPASRIPKARAAAAKRARGEKLTRDETRALEWYEQHTRQEILAAGLRALPKGVYCELAGRQQKVVDDVGRRYGIPTTGATVDLFAVVKAFHDLIAKHATVLSAEGGADWAQEKLKQQIETLKARRQLLESDLERRREELIARVDLRRRAQWIAGRLRTLSEQLGRRHGRDAQRLANDFFANLAEDLEHGEATDQDQDRAG